MNPLYTEHELSELLAYCGAEPAVVLTPFYKKVKAVQPQTSLRRVIATNIKEYLPAPLRVLFTALKEKKEGHRIALQAGDLWLGDLLHKYAKAPRPDVAVSPHDPAIFLFTGGTTGTPKAAISTHQALLMTAVQVKAWSAGLLSPWEEVVVGNMPLFHTYGNVVILGICLLGHGTMALVPNPRDLDDLVATIQKVHPSVLPAVPTLLINLLSHPKVTSGKVDLRSIKCCLSGSAPLLAETRNRFEAETGCRIMEGYGMTEGTCALVATPLNGKFKQGSVGVPMPDVEVRIVDADDGNTPMEAGQVGEIIMRAPQLMQGYWQRPDETAGMLREGPSPDSGGRWLFTGDLGYMDEDSYLFIVDRKKDLIKPSGFQVWPREVEEVIASHPAVAEVGVAGIPDARSGEAVKAWVVLRDGQQATEAEIRAYCREKLVAYKVPKQVEFRDSLPKSHMLKLLRRELAREAREAQAVPAPSQPKAEHEKSSAPQVLAPVPGMSAA
jgi:long-chain acyl-CoA synthetase